MSAMSGSDFYAYILRTFKRTDKSTEAYEAITDAVREISQSHPFNERLSETNATDTISVSGDYKFNVESDFEMFISDIVVKDGTNSWQLLKISKDEYDRRYPNQTATGVSTGKPVHYCLFNGVVYLGPVPDSTSYTYSMSYSQDISTITSVSSAVPFTDKYRVAVKYGTLFHLYSAMESDEQAQKYKALFDSELSRIILHDKRQRMGTSFVEYHGV